MPASLPAFHVSEWLNARKPPDKDAFAGRVTVVEVFQMLCPGCVSHGLPQAARIRATFAQEQVAVIGLHSVFEHHEAMTPVALRAFLAEYHLPFPVAIDEAGTGPGEGPMPRTMRAWGLEGTPSLVLIDRKGLIRARHLGSTPDMAVGAEIMQLILEKDDA